MKCELCEARYFPGNWNVNRARACPRCRPFVKREREAVRRAQRWGYRKDVQELTLKDPAFRALVAREILRAARSGELDLGTTAQVGPADLAALERAASAAAETTRLSTTVPSSRDGDTRVSRRRSR